MRTLVESLKRLYSKGQVSDEKLTQMVTEKKITAEEKQYITSQEIDSIISSNYNNNKKIKATDSTSCFVPIQ